MVTRASLRRLGSHLGGGGDPMPLVTSRGSAPHQPVGAVSHLLGVESLPALHLRDWFRSSENTTAMWYCNKQGGVGVMDPVPGDLVPLELAATPGYFTGGSTWLGLYS